MVQIPSSDGSALYTVVISPDREDVVCTCPSYAYRDYCRHTEEALAKLCTWAEDESNVLQSAHERNRQICPICGGPTHVVLQDHE